MRPEVKAILVAAREKIAKPESWTKGVMARDSVGSEEDTASPYAKCWCAMGAIRAALEDQVGIDHDAYDCLLNATFNALGDNLNGLSIPDFNDASETTHEDVLALFDRVIK